MGKQVEVTVAPRRSIWMNGVDGRPGSHVGPGGKVTVDESELERLFAQGFIVDPHAKLLTEADISAADLSAYLPNSSSVSVSEKSDQSITRGRR